MKPSLLTPVRRALGRAWTLLPWLAWPAAAQTPTAPRPLDASPAALESPAGPLIEILPPPGAPAGQAPRVISPGQTAPSVQVPPPTPPALPPQTGLPSARPAAGAPAPVRPSATPAGAPAAAPATLPMPVPLQAPMPAPIPGASAAPDSETIAAPSADQRLQLARQAQSLRQYGRAAALLRLCADQGHADCQRDLGNAYRLGQGVAVDARQALAWFEKAAAQGHAGAQNNLGLMLKNGQGQPRNVEQAAQWFGKAAAQGLAAGQNNYALMLQDGQGLPADLAGAAQWFEKAAAQGDPYAGRNLQALKRRPGWAARASGPAEAPASDSAESGQALTQALTQSPSSTRAQAVYTQRQPPINAAPLGLEVGFARLADVRKAWSGKADLTSGPTDPRSGGPSFSLPGSALGVSGLQSATLLFDRGQVLAGVVLQMLKKPFGAAQDTWAQQTLRALQGKYRTLDQHVPPSGDTWARLRQGESRIDFWLPETSFQMTVYYLSDTLSRAWPVSERLRTGQDDGRGLAGVL